jgi:hypothetical protein
MLGHGADMARGTARSNHRRVAQRRAAFQVDGDDILGLVVVQRSQDAFQQVAGRRSFANRRSSGRFPGRGLFRGFLDGLFDRFWGGLAGRRFFCGFRGFRLCGGLFRGFFCDFAGQGPGPLRSGDKI